MSNFSEDWVSILAIIIAGVIGLVKSSARKKNTRPSPVAPSVGPQREEYRRMEEEQQDEQEPLYPSETIAVEPTPAYSGDFYRAPQASWKESLLSENGTNEIEAVSFGEENNPDEPEHLQFDIRQAIIISEILQRRSY